MNQVRGLRRSIVNRAGPYNVAFKKGTFDFLYKYICLSESRFEKFD